MSDELQSVKRKIRALSEKTISNGCSENEVNVSLNMIGKLLTQFNLTMNEVYLKDERFVEEKIDTKQSKRHASESVITSIAKLCGCKTYILFNYVKGKSHRDRVINFFGYETDVKLAVYLYRMIRSAFDAELTTFKSLPAYRASGLHGKTVSTSFLYGMADRLTNRMKEMSSQSVNVEPTGRDLIVLKDQLVSAEYQGIAKKYGLVTSSVYRWVNDASAHSHGKIAGDKVNLNRPLSHNQDSIKLIGNK